MGNRQFPWQIGLSRKLMFKQTQGDVEEFVHCLFLTEMWSMNRQWKQFQALLFTHDFSCNWKLFIKLWNACFHSDGKH